MRRKILHLIDLSGSLYIHSGCGKEWFVKEWAKREGINLIPAHEIDLKPSDFMGLYKKTHDSEFRDEIEKLKVKNPIMEYLDRESIRNHPFYEPIKEFLKL